MELIQSVHALDQAKLTLRLQTDILRFMRVLIVEDDEQTGHYVAQGLAEIGYVSNRVLTGEEALIEFKTSEYDAAIVDLMLPGIDGITLISSIREQGNHTPVVIVSAKASVDERIEGLRAGGDDYITKPFSFSELVARIQAILRRTQAHGYSTKLKVADLTMDVSTRKIMRSGISINLQPREFAVLELLMRNASRVVSKTVILEHAWDFHFDTQTNVLDVLMSKLRKKIDSGFGKRLIHTVRGVGHVIKDE
jgi:DNA-binding response OmpR family regulator